METSEFPAETDDFPAENALKGEGEGEGEGKGEGRFEGQTDKQAHALASLACASFASQTGRESSKANFAGDGHGEGKSGNRGNGASRVATPIPEDLQPNEKDYFWGEKAGFGCQYPDGMRGDAKEFAERRGVDVLVLRGGFHFSWVVGGHVNQIVAPKP